VFHGPGIYVEQERHTKRRQANQQESAASDEATVHTNRSSTIYADDVKCTQARRWGILNDDRFLFAGARYRPRNGPRIADHSFAGEIMERGQIPAASEEWDQVIWDRLELHHQDPLAQKRPDIRKQMRDYVRRPHRSLSAVIWTQQAAPQLSQARRRQPHAEGTIHFAAIT